MRKLLSKRELSILYLTLALISISLIVNYLITPMLRENNAVNREIEVTKAKLKKYLLLISEKDRLQHAYQGIAASAGSPGEGHDTLVNSLAELQGLAMASEIRIRDMRPQQPSSKTHYKEMFIELRTEGKLEDYIRFIYNLENSLLLLRVERFRLNSQPNSPALEGSFTISKLSLSD